MHAERDQSFSPIERSLCYLILRNLGALQNEILEFRTVGAAGTKTSQPRLRKVGRVQQRTIRSQTTMAHHMLMTRSATQLSTITLQGWGSLSLLSNAETLLLSMQQSND